MDKKLSLLLIFTTITAFSQEKIEVLFDFDQFVLNQKTLTKLNTWVVYKKDIEVTKIYGFCDWKGTNTYNDTLSLKRVSTVFNYLEQNNIDINPNFERTGFGENFKQSKNQANNRKVIIFYKKKRLVTTDSIKTEKVHSLHAQLELAKAGDKIKLENIYFENMSSKILHKSENTLYELLHVLEDNPKLKIEIQGYICCRLDGDIYDISTTRAKAIYNFLILNKINANRLTFKGFGTTKPIYEIPEKYETEKEANRRVEVMVLEN